MKTTLEERLAGYRAAFLEKVKRWDWGEDQECSYKPRGRKPKQQTKPVKGMYRNEAEKREWEKQQAKQQPKKQKYNWF